MLVKRSDNPPAEERPGKERAGFIGPPQQPQTPVPKSVGLQSIEKSQS